MVIYFFLRVGWRLSLYSVAYRLGAVLRARFYRTLADQGPGFYHGHRTGDLMARATNDIDAIEMAAGEAMLAGFDGSTTLILVVAMMTGGIDWRLGLAALLPFPLMAFGFWRISDHIHHAWQDSLGRFSKLNNHVQETLNGVRTMRALGLQARNSGELARLAADAARSSLTAQRWEAAFEPVVGLALSTSAVITLAYGGYLVWHQQLSIGALTSFSMYLGQLVWPMFAAGWVLSLLERGRAAWGRLGPILDEAPAVRDEGVLETIQPDCARLPSRHLRLSGPAPARARRRLARARAGPDDRARRTDRRRKSTLLRLLLRQYPLQQGRDRLERDPHRGIPAGDTARHHQLGAAGAVPVLGIGRGQHRARQTRGRARGGRTGRAPRRGP